VEEIVDEYNDWDKEQHDGQHQQQGSNQSQHHGSNQSHSQPQASSHSGSGAIHGSLPNDAEKHTVRNVYDGDTLTLTDERRVRLLGIDTPEIKEKQPYAEEAKAYTKDRCNKKDIWLSFEPRGDKEDHYGRLLAFVWVEQGGQYLCINEGIVEAGYARAYHPGKGNKLHNWDLMVELQSEAKKARRGVWENFEDIEVVKTANGSAYHKRSCENLSNIRNLTAMKASEAISKGLHPCRTCFE
jgi:micrococcal nuclease